MSRQRVMLVAGALIAALAATGCGFGEGEAREAGAELRITRDFGRAQLVVERVDELREDQSIMRLLQADHRVETRFGGNFVQAIDGLAGGGGRDWFYWVNGLEGDRSAAEHELADGDVVQWDHRRWRAAMRIPAIVGAFPEPFRSGSGGKRLPVRLECADDGEQACAEVKRALTRAGARVSLGQLGAATGEQLIRVVVGRWQEVRRVKAVATIEQGPGRSGVFARFDPDLDDFELLDADGGVARTADRSSGLVAATALEGQGPVWLVTGLEEVGVEAAAALLDERTLHNAFAVAATPEGPVKLPLLEESP